MDNDNQNPVINFITIVIHSTLRNYDITYDLDGGTWVNQPTTTSFIEGTVITLPTAADVVKSGYAFLGWKDANDQIITQLTLNSDQTVTATWDWNYRVITYNINGGTWETEPETIIPKNTVITLPTNISKTGYYLEGWSYNGNMVTTITMDSDKTVDAVWMGNLYTVYFNANGGTVDTLSKSVRYGSQYGVLPTPEYVGYAFLGWSTGPNGSLVNSTDIYTILGNQTLYALWVDGSTYWTNGNPNGSVSILFYIDQSNVTNEMNIHCPLYKHDPSIPDVFETEFNESFIYTEKYLNINLKSIRSGTTNIASVIASLHNNDGTEISTSGTITLGSWKTFIITIDTVNAEISYTKVMGFRSFTNFEETSVTDVIFSYGSLGDYNGQVTQDIKFSPVTTIVPKQSIVKTSVFLNTYGVVLRDPSLDIATYFPEMTQMRLNFYSFALYGSSMTINGHTISVSAPNVTIYYTSNANENTFLDAPGTNTKEKTLELTNIYITWDGENCYLTFADDDFTVDMGTYSNKVVSFTGMWYFATALWEPYTAQETTYDVDWFNFDFALFGIVFTAMLMIAALILRVTIGAKFLDYIIIVGGIIIGLIIAGGSL